MLHPYLSYSSWDDIGLVAGLEHEFNLSIQLGMSSSQLTHIFQRGRYTTNQINNQVTTNG